MNTADNTDTNHGKLGLRRPSKAYSLPDHQGRSEALGKARESRKCT